MHEERVTSLIEFATHIQTRLENDSNSSGEDFPDLQPYTSILPFNRSDLDKSQRVALKQHAITIWNQCNVHIEQDDTRDCSVIAKSRGLAFLLLVSISQGKKKNETEKLLQNALIAAKECLRADVTDLAARILDYAIPPISSHTDRHANDTNDALNAKIAESYALKILLHWKEKRIDLAEHWYSRIDLTSVERDQDVAQRIVDLLLEIGVDCLHQQKFNDACRWLERAQKVLEHGQNSTIFSGSEIRLHVLHRIVQALLGLAGALTSDAKHKTIHHARGIIAQMRKEAKPSLSTLLLSLETQTSQVDYNVDSASADLMEIIRTAHIVEGPHSSVLHYLRRLWPLAPGLSADCFRYYIVHRLKPQGDMELLEKTIINYLGCYLDHNGHSNSASFHQLEADFSSFKNLINGPLSSVAAQAAHIIIWKKVSDMETDNSLSTAMLLCQIGLHPLLSSATEASLAKFERQLVSYHLLVTNNAAATEILDNMSMKQKNNRYSRYLSYCLAIRSGNEADVQSDLNAILNGTGESDQLLYACLGESIKHNRDRDTARMMQRLIDQQIRAKPSPETRDLLKYVVGVLVKICDSQQPDTTVREEFQARLCAAFESAAYLQEKSRSENYNWKWFSEQSFSLARRHVKAWPRKHIVDLLHYSNQILLAGTRGFAEAMLSKEEEQRLFDGDFMRIILYAAESRKIGDKYSVEDLPRTSYTSRSKLGSSDYHHVLQKQVFDIYTVVLKRQQAAIAVDENERQEILARLHILIPLAFEALLYMNTSSYISGEAMFDEVSVRQFLRKANELEATSITFALLADIVLSFASGDEEAQSRCNGLRIPSLVAAKLLGQIVKTLREAKSYDLDQAARWIRCVVQLLLDDIYKVLTIAKESNAEKLGCELSFTMLDSLMEQVCELASTMPSDMMSEDLETSMYPSDELRWLASKIFNLAVDLYMLEKRELARDWASKALKVAKVMYKVCGTIAARDLIALLEQKIRMMKLDTRSD